MIYLEQKLVKNNSRDLQPLGETYNKKKNEKLE